MTDSPSHPISEVGERKLIDMIMKLLGEKRVNLLPYPEDAVAVELGGKIVVLKTDSFVASTDMPAQMSYYHAGYKTVIMNISDLAAKGATPKYMLTSICVPKQTLTKDVLALMKGVKDAAEKYDVVVLGGDTNQAEDLMINGFAVGFADKSILMPRKGCKPGDFLAVTGYFGLTSVALKILLNKREAEPYLRGKALNAMFKPEARLKEGRALATAKAVTSSIDSSDGLLESLRELMKVNRLGFLMEKLPAAEGVEGFAVSNNLSLDDLVLRGGEEFELVVTINPNKIDAAKKAVEKSGGRLHIIGRVIEEEKILLVKEDRKLEVKGKGYEHFTI